MKIVVIGDEDTVLAFSVLGVTPVPVNSSSEMLKQFEKYMTERDIGLIILTENYAKDIEDTINSYRLKKPYPAVIRIPSRKERERVVLDYSRILKKVIGFRT